MILNLILATVLLFSLITIKVATDYRQWLAKRNQVLNKSIIQHGKEWLLMVVGTAPSIYLFAKQSAFIWPVAALLSAYMCAWIIWNFFDGIFNVIRRFGWFYHGSGESTAANTDRIPAWLAIPLKVGGLIFFIYTYLNNLR